MKEVNVITENMIKMINSEVVAGIIESSGYFDDVEDISSQLAMGNAMAFDVFMAPELIEDLHRDLAITNTRVHPVEVEEGVSKRINYYVERAIEDISKSVEEALYIQNVTTSYVITDINDGISLLLYFYFSDYYLN